MIKRETADRIGKDWMKKREKEIEVKKREKEIEVKKREKEIEVKK